MTSPIEHDRAAPAPDAPPYRADISRLTYLIALLLLAAASVAVVCYATREGMGLSVDSDQYLQAARQIRAGRGVTLPTPDGGMRPLTHFPPLYPLVLAGTSRLGTELETAARVVNVILLVGSVHLAGMIFRRGMGMTRRGSLVGVALLASAADLVMCHTRVWSEGLFVFLLLAALALLGAFIERGRRAAVIGAGVVTALAVLTRYAGAGLVLAGVIALLVVARHRSWRQRLVDVALFVAISCLPAAAWVTRNVSQTGTAANRAAAFHPPSREALEEGLDAIGEWARPLPPEWLIVAALVVVAVISARNARREGRPPRPAALATACFAAVYALFLLASVTFADAHTQLDARILAPLHVAVTIGVVAELSRSSLPASAGRWARAWPLALFVLAMILIAGRAGRAGVFAYQAPDEHLGLGVRHWRTSDVLGYVRRLPADALIYTNRRAVVQLHTGRLVRELPAQVHAVTREPADAADVQRRLARIAHDLRARAGYVVWFSAVDATRLVPEDQLRRDLDLQLVYAGRDGNVYQTRPAATGVDRDRARQD